MNNVIISGFNAIRKVITKGYSQFNFGISVKICRTHVKPFISNSLKAKEFISQEIHFRKYISQSLVAL